MAFTTIPSFTTVAANNTDINNVSVAEGWPAANINNSIRNLTAMLKEEFAVLSTVTAAATTDISSNGAYTVSGATTITAFTIVSGSERTLIFSGAPLLTYHATNLIIPTGANLQLSAGDVIRVRAVGTNQVRVTDYLPADGTSVAWKNASTVTAASGDLIPIKDVSASNAPAFVTASTIAALAPIKFINRFSATPYTSNADLSTTIPLDDTTPTSSEGTQILSVSVTTTTTTQIVRLRFSGNAAAPTSVPIAAMFRDTTCIQVSNAYLAFNTSYYGVMSMDVEDAPGAAATYTYTVRVGASSGTMRMNGSTTARLFGGAAKCILIADLIEP